MKNDVKWCIREISSYWEFFFGHFKDHVNYKACDNYHQLKQEVDLFMEEYNHHRYQWGLEKMTPAQYRGHLLAA
ncbi:IS3 family transposase [Bacillus sp. UMB0893]|uniref:IS3 family transposase n=1 Tax=Bacillus sp. UMB0893 TaxID=2066053 RepID=UPI000C784889|nr:hypothetical protein CYJ36_05085 [Bacillus sp. UMB0893]QNG61934.1 IS3 family transposase [Bacillus sp. PAMC26568]